MGTQGLLLVQGKKVSSAEPERATYLRHGYRLRRRRSRWKLCLLVLSLPWQRGACEFSAPLLRVLESCASGPGLLGSRRAQCVPLARAPAALRRPRMALEGCQTLRG